MSGLDEDNGEAFWYVGLDIIIGIMAVAVCVRVGIRVGIRVRVGMWLVRQCLSVTGYGLRVMGYGLYGLMFKCDGLRVTG